MSLGAPFSFDSRMFNREMLLNRKRLRYDTKLIISTA